MEKIAFVFPGQGSQSLGMLVDLANIYPEIKLSYQSASDVLGYDLWKLVQEGPASQLDQTRYTQPALLAGSYGIYRILKDKFATKIGYFAGHSLGEYTALVCANSLSFTDAIQLVAHRGQYMQEAVAEGEGAMAAIIGLSDERVNTLCKETIANSSFILTPANYNSLGQVVIAGHQEAVEEAIKRAKEIGAKMAILLPVSVPAHCPLMQPAVKPLGLKLDTIALKSPMLPIINNVDVKPYTDAASIRNGLSRQLYSPVRWVETIQHMMTEGVTRIIECGPGKVLTGLNKRINKQLQCQTTSDLVSLQAVLSWDKNDVE